MTQTYIIYDKETFKIKSTFHFYPYRMNEYCSRFKNASWVNANHKGDREIVEKINKVNNTNY